MSPSTIDFKQRDVASSSVGEDADGTLREPWAEQIANAAAARRLQRLPHPVLQALLIRTL